MLQAPLAASTPSALLVELGADVHARDEGRRTCLHCATKSAGGEGVAVEMTRLLLAAGADVKAADAQGRTPLHVVWHAECVDVLLEAGADLEARDGRDRTPAGAFVSAWSRAEVLLRLADRGADLVNAGGEAGAVERRVEELRAKLRCDQHG